jgi:hypothetical protein
LVLSEDCLVLEINEKFLKRKIFPNCEKKLIEIISLIRRVIKIREKEIKEHLF